MSSPEATEPPNDSAAAARAAEADARRRRTVRFAVVLGIAGIVAVAAILVAVSLDQASGTKPQTSASIAAGPVVAPGDQLTGGQSKLPPLAVVLDRTDAASSMTAADQVVALREELATKPTSAGYLDLGQAYMTLGDEVSAQSAFARAAALAPASPGPLVGLAMTEGMSGTAGLASANALMTQLQTRFPTSQVVAFNIGWLALYRADVTTLRNAWARTIVLGPTTALGDLARGLLSEIGKKTGSK
jgi:cytochrome c-type biogenesis protein CcmH/NrfG